MNRAKKTKQYLKEQLDIFKGYGDLRDYREAFFPAIARFRAAVVSSLRSTGMISQDDLDKLDNILASIDTMKSKGHDNKVYWSRVGPEFDKTKVMLYDFIHRMDETKVPPSIKCKDFVKDLFSGKSAIFVILSAITLLIVALLTDLGGLLIDYFISFFK